MLKSKGQTLGAVFVVEFFEPSCFGGLPLDQAEPAFGGIELLSRDSQVRFGFVELALGFDAALPILGNTSGLFKDHPAFHRRCQEHSVHLALFDDRVGVGADAGVEEEVADVFEPGELAVDEVLAFAIAVESALDLDLVRVDGERTRDVAAFGDDARGFTFAITDGLVGLGVGDVLVVGRVVLAGFDIFDFDDMAFLGFGRCLPGEFGEHLGGLGVVEAQGDGGHS